MAVQVIDEKTFPAILFHPLQHTNQFFIRKMMTKQRRKNNVGLFVSKVNVCIITANPLAGKRGILLLRKSNTFRVDVNTGKNSLYVFLHAKLVKGKKIITAAASNFTDIDRASIFYQLPDTTDRNGMATQPGIDDIKFF